MLLILFKLFMTIGNKQETLCTYAEGTNYSSPLKDDEACVRTWQQFATIIQYVLWCLQSWQIHINHFIYLFIIWNLNEYMSKYDCRIRKLVLVYTHLIATCVPHVQLGSFYTMTNSDMITENKFTDHSKMWKWKAANINIAKNIKNYVFNKQ